MATVVKKGDEGDDAIERDEEERDEREQPGEEQRSGGPSGPSGPTRSEMPSGGGGGFFSIYKPGQGYWTRMGTVICSAGLVLALGQFLYEQLLIARFGVPAKWAGISVGSLVVAGGVVLWYYLNKPSVVDFLIATESEMKKVNWTSRKDLIGSTKVVIIFMFLISFILFMIDVFFGYFFWLIGVLKHGPFA